MYLGSVKFVDVKADGMYSEHYSLKGYSFLVPSVCVQSSDRAVNSQYSPYSCGNFSDISVTGVDYTDICRLNKHSAMTIHDFALHFWRHQENHKGNKSKAMLNVRFLLMTMYCVTIIIIIQ